jgi:hypothetical protein
VIVPDRYVKQIDIISIYLSSMFLQFKQVVKCFIPALDFNEHFKIILEKDNIGTKHSHQRSELYERKNKEII